MLTNVSDRLLEAAAPDMGTAASLFVRTRCYNPSTDVQPTDQGGDPDVLTTCVNDEFTGTAVLDGIEPLDPLSKQCPDDVPCRVHDSELWFAESPSDLELAKALCQECPALLACLSGAVERREPWGVWGGQIFERGVIVARKRPRGRPRKDDRAGVAA